MNSAADPRSDAGGAPAADPATLDFYNQNAATYVGARPPEIAPDLLAFLPRLAVGLHRVDN